MYFCCLCKSLHYLTRPPPFFRYLYPPFYNWRKERVSCKQMHSPWVKYEEYWAVLFTSSLKLMFIPRNDVFTRVLLRARKNRPVSLQGEEGRITDVPGPNPRSRFPAYFFLQIRSSSPNQSFVFAFQWQKSNFSSENMCKFKRISSGLFCNWFRS